MVSGDGRDQVVDYGGRGTLDAAISVVVSNAAIMPNGIMRECMDDGDWVGQDRQTTRRAPGARPFPK